MNKIPTWAKVWIITAVVVGGVYLYTRIKRGGKKGGKPPKKILFVGDSITATTWKGKPTNTYPTLIQKARPDLQIDVIAIGGKTTKWMLDTLPSKLNNKYDRIYVYGGANDAFSEYVKLDTAVSNMQKMIDLINQSGAEAWVVIGIEPRGYSDWRKMPINQYMKRKEDYIPLVERYVQLQDKYRGLKNANFVPKFQISGSMTSDGQHPSGSGQQIIANDIMKTF